MRLPGRGPCKYTGANGCGGSVHAGEEGGGEEGHAGGCLEEQRGGTQHSPAVELRFYLRRTRGRRQLPPLGSASSLQKQGRLVSWGGPAALCTHPGTPLGSPRGSHPWVVQGHTARFSRERPLLLLAKGTEHTCCSSALQQWKRCPGLLSTSAMPVPTRSLFALVPTVSVGVCSLLVRHHPGCGVVHLQRDGMGAQCWLAQCWRGRTPGLLCVHHC